LFLAPMAAWNLDLTVLCCIPQETTLDSLYQIFTETNYKYKNS
jgi:hypothetical protein